MAKTAILAVKIISDAKDAAAGFDAVGGKASKLGGALKIAGGAAIAMGAALGGAVLKGIGDAGNLEQSIGAIDAVFKNNAGEMHAWADNAAETVGLAKNEYNELATLIGTQLKNGGTAMDELGGKTNDLIGLGSDLSAMFGGTTADAVGALSSALKGERDPIEKYGVSLTQAAIDAKAAQMGFEKVGGALSTEANQAATLALIMEQTSDAHGTFSKESGTLAHKQQVFAAKLENLSAKLGMIFLPIATAVFGFLGDVAVPALEKVIQWLSPLGDLFRGIGQNASGALAPFESLAGLSGQFSGAIQQNIIPAFQRFGETAQGWADKIRPIIQEITGFVLEKFREWQPVIAEVFGLVTEIIGGAMDLIAAIITPVIDYLAGSWKVWGGLIMEYVGFAFNQVAAIVKTVLGVISGVIKVVTGLISGDWSKVWAGIKQIASSVWNGIKTIFVNSANFLHTMLSGVWRKVSGAASSAWSSFKQTVSGGINAAAGYVAGLPGRIAGALSGLASRLYNIGADMMRGMVNGIRSMAGRLAQSARDTVRGAVDSAKSFLGIRSPSRLWGELGYESVRGLVAALNAGHNLAGRAGHNLAAAATSDATVPVPGITAGRAGARGAVTVNINVNGALDPRAVANQLRTILNNDARVRGVVDLGGVVIA